MFYINDRCICYLFSFLREAVNTIAAVLKSPINITAPLTPLSDVEGLCFTVVLVVVFKAVAEEDIFEETVVETDVMDVSAGNALCAAEAAVTDVATGTCVVVETTEDEGFIEVEAAVVAEADVVVVVAGAAVVT